MNNKNCYVGAFLRVTRKAGSNSLYDHPKNFAQFADDHNIVDRLVEVDREKSIKGLDQCWILIPNKKDSGGLVSTEGEVFQRIYMDNITSSQSVFAREYMKEIQMINDVYDVDLAFGVIVYYE